MPSGTLSEDAAQSQLKREWSLWSGLPLTNCSYCESRILSAIRHLRVRVLPPQPRSRSLWARQASWNDPILARSAVRGEQFSIGLYASPAGEAIDLA